MNIYIYIYIYIYIVIYSNYTHTHTHTHTHTYTHTHTHTHIHYIYIYIYIYIITIRLQYITIRLGSIFVRIYFRADLLSCVCIFNCIFQLPQYKYNSRKYVFMCLRLQTTNDPNILQIFKNIY